MLCAEASQGFTSLHDGSFLSISLPAYTTAHADCFARPYSLRVDVNDYAARGHNAALLGTCSVVDQSVGSAQGCGAAGRQGHLSLATVSTQTRSVASVGYAACAL